MKKQTMHSICSQIISLENEIEFLKQIKKPSASQKKELKNLYQKLQNIKNLQSSEQSNVL